MSLQKYVPNYEDMKKVYDMKNKMDRMIELKKILYTLPLDELKILMEITVKKIESFLNENQDILEIKINEKLTCPKCHSILRYNIKSEEEYYLLSQKIMQYILTNTYIYCDKCNCI